MDPSQRELENEKRFWTNWTIQQTVLKAFTKMS